MFAKFSGLQKLTILLITLGLLSAFISNYLSSGPKCNPKLYKSHEGSKWMVLTTINYPTETIDILSKMRGWKIVVVGDKKTPKDWNHTNCVFLSVEKQNELGYEISKLLPFNHYSRKNIGYLYAIQQGAELIYETDDDNQPLRTSFDYLPENALLKEISGNSGVVNPYAHFGEPSIWPRGFPLDRIHKQVLRLGSDRETLASVQQGIANNDPDVDAIFRLTRKLEITFEPCAEPVSIYRRQLTPYNSQTTFHYRSAFWGLVIPITTTFRVCDIWRGYFTERLLWEIGSSLVFLPPTVIQYRNAHSLLRDFEEENDLYTKSGHLVDFLGQWRANGTNLFQKMIRLAGDMNQAQFWGYKDVLLMEAWVKDLKKIGYKPPRIVDEWIHA